MCRYVLFSCGAHLKLLPFSFAFLWRYQQSQVHKSCIKTYNLQCFTGLHHYIFNRIKNILVCQYIGPIRVALFQSDRHNTYLFFNESMLHPWEAFKDFSTGVMKSVLVMTSFNCPLTQSESPANLSHDWLSYRPGWWWQSQTRPVRAQGSEARLRSPPTPQRCSWCGPAAHWWTPSFPSGSAAGGWSGCRYRRADSAGRPVRSAYTPRCMSSPDVLRSSGVGSTPGLQRSRSH